MPFCKSHSLAFWLSNLTSGAALVTITNVVMSLLPTKLICNYRDENVQIHRMQDFLPEYWVYQIQSWLTARKLFSLSCDRESCSNAQFKLLGQLLTGGQTLHPSPGKTPSSSGLLTMFGHQSTWLCEWQITWLNLNPRRTLCSLNLESHTSHCQLTVLRIWLQRNW